MAAGFEISFIDTETARWLENAPDDGLCLKRFRSDFTVDNLRSFEEGERIVIDEESYLIISKEILTDFLKKIEKLLLCILTKIPPSMYNFDAFIY